MKNFRTTLHNNTLDFLRDGIKTVAHSDQKHFYYNVNQSVEKGFKMMIEGLEIYAEAHLDEYGTPVGEDYFAGPCLEEITRALRQLESGFGRFDGGTLDKTLCEIAEKHKLDIE